MAGAKPSTPYTSAVSPAHSGFLFMSHLICMFTGFSSWWISWKIQSCLVCVRVHVPINLRRHSNGVPKALSEGIYTKQSKWLSFNKIIQNLYKIHLRERSQVVYAKICQTNSILNAMFRHLQINHYNLYPACHHDKRICPAGHMGLPADSRKPLEALSWVLCRMFHLGLAHNTWIISSQNQDNVMGLNIIMEYYTILIQISGIW